MRDVAVAKKALKPDERSVTRIQDFQADPVLFEYCRDKKILQYVEAFVGENIMAMHSMLVNKPPDPSSKTSRHPMHQDLRYFPFRPADRIVCSWTAMQHVDRSNGCLVVLPGSHHGKLLQHEYPQYEGGVNKWYHGVRDFDPNAPMLHLVVEPGDTVFFHPLLIHGSGANTTTGYRKAISCHYASSMCNYIDVTGTSQEEILKEIMDVATRKLGRGKKIEGKDLWRFKGKVAQGRRMQL